MDKQDQIRTVVDYLNSKMENKNIYQIIEKCLNYVKSNLDDFNEVLEENYLENDIENCILLVKWFDKNSDQNG